MTPLPTTTQITPVVPQMINLGYYVKAKEILTIIAELEGRPLMPAPNHQ